MRTTSTPRRGMGVLLVLLLISLTMAVSYAVLRQQEVAGFTRQNNDLDALARQAAMSGASEAIRAMNDSAWTGVDTSINRSLTANQWFVASFVTGDATLSPGSSSPTDEDKEYPYRVTVTSVGHAKDPHDANRVASHTVEAVLRLIPRHTPDEPAGWSDLTENTVCQYVTGDYSFMTNVGSRIEGPVRLRGSIDFCNSEMTWNLDLYGDRWYYMAFLDAMKDNGVADWRLFTGPVKLRFDSQGATALLCLAYAADLHPSNLVDTGSNSAAYTWCDPFPSATYRLYPGGKQYSVETIACRDVNGTAYRPNLLTNPLGLFQASGKVRFLGNAAIEGTLAVLGPEDLEVSGSNNSATSPTLPPYGFAAESGEVRLRLPTLVVTDDIRVQSGAGLNVDGMVLAKDEYEVARSGQTSITMRVRGNVAAADFLIRRRNEFNQTASWWTDRLNQFASSGATYWPLWLRDNFGLDPQTRIKFLPPIDTVPTHWFSTDGALFDAHPDDGGLRWDLIRWEEKR